MPSGVWRALAETVCERESGSTSTAPTIPLFASVVCTPVSLRAFILCHWTKYAWAWHDHRLQPCVVRSGDLGEVTPFLTNHNHDSRPTPQSVAC